VRYAGDANGGTVSTPQDKCRPPTVGLSEFPRNDHSPPVAAGDTHPEQLHRRHYHWLRAGVAVTRIEYAQQSYWDGYFKDADLDWGGLWTQPFIPLLQSAGANDVLELGCGSGHDAARLAREGFNVVATDISEEALAQAERRYGDIVQFRPVDTARELPFLDSSFDAVMANVALHMFSDTVTRAVFAEVRRILRPAGLFLFHVNAHDDRPLRERWRPVLRQLEPDYVLEEAGQTVRFFSEEYVRMLLAGCEIVILEHLEIPHRKTNEPFKRVWRVAARTPNETMSARLP